MDSIHERPSHFSKSIIDHRQSLNSGSRGKLLLLMGSLAIAVALALTPLLFTTTFAVQSSGAFQPLVLVSGSNVPLNRSNLANGSIVITARITSGTKIGSVVLVISPLTFSRGRYSNVQTTTVKSTTGALMNGVAITMYENAGKSGGYYHGVTGPSKYPAGETIVHDTYPGTGSYTEWSSANSNGQVVLSLKITIIVP